MKFQFADLKPADTSTDAEPTHNVVVKDLAINTEDICIVDVLDSPEYLGRIEHGYNKHFYTRGAFDLVQLVLYILRQTGPADVVISSYSISEHTLKTLRKMVDKGEITHIRFLIDNRVRSISPKPFDVMIHSFPGCYKCLALHAKVALISNAEWKITVIGSQNATHNPKLERGIIHTDPNIYVFDEYVLNDEFDKGTT